MSAAATVNLSAASLKVIGFVIGDTLDLAIDFTPSGSFDFSGADGNMQLVNKSTNELIADLTTGGGEILFPTADQIRVLVADDVTALWPSCTVVGDIQVVFNDGSTRTMVDLEIVLKKPVTPV